MFVEIIKSGRTSDALNWKIRRGSPLIPTLEASDLMIAEWHFREDVCIINVSLSI
jgi:hypothetical protein